MGARRPLAGHRVRAVDKRNGQAMPAPFSRLFLLSALLCAAATPSLLAGTFIVTNTNDSGLGSLRQAILDVNGRIDPETIVFSIETVPRRIRLLTPLPGLFQGSIDGTTQPGYAGTPLIEIDGSLLPAFSRCLSVGGSKESPATVKALVVNRCSYIGIDTFGHVTVTGSYIGTDLTGQIARGNGVGIQANGFGDVIGGSTPAARNVISGNDYGIVVGADVAVFGNFIGTNAAGTAAVPNLTAGVSAKDSASIRIGGSAAGESNVISGNQNYGIELSNAVNVLILGNLIGPSASGAVFPPQRAGIAAFQSTLVQIGGIGPGEANVIAYAADAGIGVHSTSKRFFIGGNSMFGNGFGIDLDFDLENAGSRITPNDPLDKDLGGNLLQNFPVLSTVTSEGASTRARGTLHSAVNEPFTIVFYSNTECNASGHGEGRAYIGRAFVTTDASGDASFDELLDASVPSGGVVTATAIDQFTNTSEFSACKPVGLKFFTLDPCRLVDTREPDGPVGGPALQPASRRVFPLAGSCGIPADAVSLAVNVTATEASAPGYLTIVRGDAPTTEASTINFREGFSRSNNAVVPLSSDTAIAVTNGGAGTVHFILDVTGYFR
jgi:hypothetical protein